MSVNTSAHRAVRLHVRVSVSLSALLCRNIIMSAWGNLLEAAASVWQTAMKNILSIVLPAASVYRVWPNVFQQQQQSTSVSSLLQSHVTVWPEKWDKKLLFVSLLTSIYLLRSQESGDVSVETYSKGALQCSKNRAKSDTK